MNPLQLSNKWYDRLKFLAQIGLPGVGALYFALANIWSLPAAEQVVGTITAIDVFLGLLLGASSKGYLDKNPSFDGAMIVNEDPKTGKKTAVLRMNELENPMEAFDKDELKIQVKKE